VATIKTGTVVASTRQLAATRFFKTRLPPPVIDVYFASKVLANTLRSPYCVGHAAIGVRPKLYRDVEFG
jgi:hypothetical protein